MRSFALEFEIRKGFGPGWARKTVFVGLDDLEPEMSEGEIRELAVQDAEEQLSRPSDYPLYGKNWRLVEIHAA